MSSKRKTISVEKLLFRANTFLRQSGADQQGARSGVASFIEGILMETGNYHGFRYLDASEVPAGCLPGIDRSKETVDEYHVARNVEFPDETRRRYH